MKVPQIKPCSVEEFQKLPQKEQFKHKASGMLREYVGKEYGIWTKPENEYQTYGNFWARISNIIKDRFQGRIK